jgi:Na+/melibiose symporter-like transporter
MIKLAHQFTEPLRSVTDRPWQFIVWWLVAIVVGSAGFWLPILLVWYDGGPTSDKFALLIYAGTLASFSVVLLSEGLAATLIVVDAGTNDTAAGMRAFFGSIAVLLVLTHVGFLAHTQSNTRPSGTSIAVQLAATALAIALASYLYCFRYPSWEKGVEEVVEEEEAEVKGLSASAEKKSTDDGGTKL